MPTTEIIIIGGGIIGSSIAYHLARQGRSVVVVERDGVAVEPSASWASAGGVRRQGRHPAEARLAVEAIARWPTLAQELDADLGYRQGGNLYLAETDADAERLVAFVHRQHENGFSDVRLVDRAEVRVLVPGISERVTAGSYSPADGQADPPRVTHAFATAAQRAGNVYLTNLTCLAILTSGSRVSGVRTDHGDLPADAVVLAAGAWSDDLVAPFGVTLPIRTRALQMLLSTPGAPGLLHPVLGSVSRPLSLKQLDDGAFLIGGGWLGDPTPDRRGYTLRERSQSGNWKDAIALLPTAGQQRIARAWCGLEAESFDGLPFIGPLPGIEGLTLATGFSGHGFALAPAVGRAIADQLAGLPTSELDALSPTRIASFDPAAVSAFRSAPAPSDALEE